MAHEIVFDEHRNINPVAFVGEVPWHGLGQQIAPHSPLETWAQQAGMDWEIKSGPALYMDDEGLLRGYPRRQMLRRGDTQYPLCLGPSEQCDRVGGPQTQYPHRRPQAR
jgi:hypothetical protein